MRTSSPCPLLGLKSAHQQCPPKKTCLSFRKKVFRYFDNPKTVVEANGKASEVDGISVRLGDVVKYDGYRTENTYIAVPQGESLMWIEPKSTYGGHYIIIPSGLIHAPNGYWNLNDGDDGWDIVGVDPSGMAINENSPTDEEWADELVGKAEDLTAIFTNAEKDFLVNYYARESAEYYVDMADYIKQNKSKMLEVCQSEYYGKTPLVEALTDFAGVSRKTNLVTGLHTFVQIFGVRMLLCVGL